MLFVGDGHRLLDVFRTHQLDVTVFVIVHLGQDLHEEDREEEKGEEREKERRGEKEEVRKKRERK